ncbi:phage tail tip fiber protein [Roseateles sp. BYS96W]|uniref:Fibronectin type-III domain-containing protein n=1 Tax=Pelomonas nitida TaxID=3299027 RepID=A0ABW7G7H0_9BURK
MALVSDSLTIPPASSLNGTGASASARQVAAAASRAVVPLVYGEDRIGGLVLNVLPKAGTPGTLLVQVLWCLGCDSINDLRLGDEVLPASITAVHYAGDQTAADATLAAAIAAQGITAAVRPLTGHAWSLITMPAALFSGTLNFTARIRGRKCYDPAFDTTAGGAGPQRLADPSTWAYSEVPAVCLGDFLASKAYGCGVAVDWASVKAVGAANRAIVPGSSEMRRVLGVSFTTPSAAKDVAETLRAYAGCFLLPSAGGVRLLADANDAPAATYRHTSGDISAIDSLELRDLNQAPTAVEVIYTDTSAIPWRDASAVAQLDGAGTTKPWRLSQVRMPGIHRYSQALREATERLNKLVLFDVSTSLEVFDNGIRHDEGDIINVEHPIGLAMEAMRVTAVSLAGPGRWRLDLVRHSAAAYSDSVATVAATVDGARVLPIAPPANVEGLVGAVGKGVITWSWTPSAERYYLETRARLNGSNWDTATPLWFGRASALVQTVGAPGTYTLRVRHAVIDGQESLGTTSASVTVTTADLDPTQPDPTPPPQPTLPTLTPGFATVLIEQALPTYTVGHGHGTTRVYGKAYTSGPLPTFADAKLLGEFAGGAYGLPCALGTTLRLWITWVTRDGYESTTPAGGTNGMAVTTGKIGNADIAPLAIAAAQLANDAVDLGGSKVTGTITDPARFGAAAIGYTVTQYLVATSGVMGNLVVDNGQISSLSVAKLLGGSLSVSAYIQSQNYSQGVSGWRINADGTAEFSAASIRGQLTAAQIDSRGLSIKDAAGNVLLAAGTPLAASNITPAAGWLNSNISIGANGALIGGAGGQVTLPGLGLRAYTISSTGYTSTPRIAIGLWRDGAQIDGSGAWWNFRVINRYTGVLGYAVTWHPGDADSKCDDIAAALNAFGNSYILAVWTNDHPSGKMPLAPLIAAMKRCGASALKLQGATFTGMFRAAYCMVGVCGAGEGTGLEVIAPASAMAIELPFSLDANGNLLGVNAGKTTIVDYGYTGDLNATNGAPAGTYVGSNLAQDLETLAGAQAKADAAANSATSAANTYAAAVADLARINAQAHADNIVDAEETRAIADASNKAEAARAAAVAAAAADATAKADVAALTANWSGVTGPGKPQDNATVGATIGTNLGGAFTQASWDVVMSNAYIRASHIQQLTANNLTVDALSRTVNGQVSGSPSGARVEITANRVSIYNSSNAERVRLSA